MCIFNCVCQKLANRAKMFTNANTVKCPVTLVSIIVQLMARAWSLEAGWQVSWACRGEERAGIVRDVLMISHLSPVQRLTSCCFHSANNSQRVGPFAVFRLLRVLPWSTLLRPPPLKWFLILEVRCPSMFALTGIWTLSSSARRFSKRGSGNSERWSDLSKISQSCPQSLVSSPLLLLMSTALCISSACYPC